MKVASESEVTQSCPTLSDPMDCSPPGSSIHGFSRQEYWSGVPLPSPEVMNAAAAAKSLQSCPTLRPHRRQPARLTCPWDPPGKNTGVSCHFLLQCLKVKGESEVAQSCPTLSDPMDCSPPGSSVHGFSRQEYWSGVPLPSPNYLLDICYTISCPTRISN